VVLGKGGRSAEGGQAGFLKQRNRRVLNAVTSVSIDEITGIQALERTGKVTGVVGDTRTE